ncbi:MAG TPA: type II toxin-antitoxin system RelE/ParE family toxin [Candidatus Babeliales bacterium]|nr:type II toxin-antitoxin system RelE/ParE family toxin [Candidatus Babeliales bacterium]
MAIEWVIKYWPNDIERWLKKLTKEQQKAVIKLIELLRANNQLKLPHSRQLGNKLFELRDKRFGYRVYYMYYKDHLIILLAAGDKSTQDRDMKIAYSRLNEIVKYGVDFV